jgi:protein SCO1
VKRRVVLALFGALAACAPPQKLDVLGEVPDFELTAQDGKPFDSRSLEGHVWVADFIFTNCPGPCPMMSSQMRKLQMQTGADVKLVSITVDPARDTPPVLAEYAKHFQYDPARWHFLTGDQAKLSALGTETFHLNSVDGSLNHSTRFALVDRRRRIRGYYSTGEDGFLTRLIRDIRTLQNDAT